MIQTPAIDQTKAWTRNRQQQQRKTEQLQEQTQGLLNLAAVFELGADVRVGPKTQRRDNLFALGAVEHVEGDDTGGDSSQQAQQLAQAQIDKVHCNVPLVTMGPKIASSTGTSVGMP